MMMKQTTRFGGKHMKKAGFLMVLAGVLLAVSLIGCSDSDNDSPISERTVYQAGMAWDVDHGDGEVPIPVWWNGEDSPTKLPMLPFSEEGCPPSGSVEAMTIVGDDVVMVGISSLCLEGNQNMKPALWQGGTVTQLALLPDSILGTALDVAYLEEVLYVVGATGIFGPLPVLWVDGYPIELPLPDDYEYGEALKIVIEEGLIYISGLLSKGVSGDLTWAVGYWKMDSSLEWEEWTYVTLPEDAGGANRPLALTTDGEDVWSVANAYGVEDINSTKPALSTNGGTPTPLIDFEFEQEPWGMTMGLTNAGTTTLAVGYVTLEEQYGLPGPVFWTDTAMDKLSTADETLGLGSANCVALDGNDIYIGGQTYKKDPEDETVLIAVPAYWMNGVRHDREGLSQSGTVSYKSDTLGSWPAWPDIPATHNLPASDYGVNASQSAVVYAIVLK
jgi:hypothetical protein